MIILLDSMIWIVSDSMRIWLWSTERRMIRSFTDDAVRSPRDTRLNCANDG